MWVVEIISQATSAAVAILVMLIGSWFAVRVHKLEDRVDTLEDERDSDRSYIAKLKAFIYRLNLEPPLRDEE